MSNPYRAKPAGGRVNHTAISGYGSQNQNAWNTMPEGRPGIPSANVYQQQPSAMIQQQQQQQQSQDSWDWGTDNGNNGNNDSWNWSVDQKPDSQQQHSSQSHQFNSGQISNSQSIQNPQSAGMYYQNVNRNVGNAANVPNQHPGSGGNTPRTNLSRESTPNNKDPYNQYTSYDYNQRPPPQQQQQQQQQYHLPPRPSSKSSPALSDHSQWSASQQTQNLPAIGHNSPAQQENVKTIQTTPPHPPQTNNFNWHSGSQQINPSPHNWQNHTEAPVSGSTWQEPNKQQSSENSNQWQQSEQTSQAFVPPKEYPAPGDAEHSLNWQSQQPQQNNLSNNQIPNYSYGAPNENSTASVAHQNAGANTNQWHQPLFQPSIPSEESISLQSTVPANPWQQPLSRHENVTANDWSPPQPKPLEFGSTETDASFANYQRQDSIEVMESHHKNLNDWQQIQPPPSHFASSTSSSIISHSSNSVERILSAKDQVSERKRSVGMAPASSAPVNDSLIQTKPNIVERKSSGESMWPESEIHSGTNNPENIDSAQNNFDTDWTTTDEWNAIPVSELSSGISQLNISSKSNNRQLETQTIRSDIHSSSYSSDNLSSQPISVSLSENVSEIQSHDSVPNPQPEHFRDTVEKVHSAESDRRLDSQNTNPPQFAPQEHRSAQANQIDNNTAPEVVPQTAGYDQWYAQRSTAASQPENNWYRNDVQSKSSQKWNPPERNIENYENIQQPAEFVNSEVVTPMIQKRNIYGSHDSINRETLDNEPKSNTSLPKGEIPPPRDFQEDINNVEVPSIHHAQQSLQVEQAPDNYEFASNDRNTFLETGELTDSHQQHEPTPPSQDDENDEVPNDIPFLREVPGQSSSSSDPRRNDPTGQEQNVPIGPRSSDPRRNDPSGQEHTVTQPIRNIGERTERRDLPPGQERTVPLPPRVDTEILERRNDPSGRERSLPPQQSRNDTAADSRRNLSETRRNDPSGEECLQPQLIPQSETTDLREVPGRGTDNDEPIQQADSAVRQIPGGESPIEDIQVSNDRDDARVVTGSREAAASIPATSKHDQSNETRNKREEAVGASLGENLGVPSQINRRDSFEEGDDEGSGNSRDESRERRRERSPERRGYDYERSGRYYERDRDFDENYYYERRRVDNDRTYNSREDLDRREVTYREDERRHTSRDDLDRRGRDQEDPDRKGRGRDDVEDRRRREEDRRNGRTEVDPRTRNPSRDYDARYLRDREYPERDRRRGAGGGPEARRGRRYEDYDPQDPYRRDYYEDPYNRNSRPSSRSSYNDRDRDYYTRGRDPYYGYNGTKAYGSGYPDSYGANYGTNYYAYLENMRRTNPAAYMEWYRRYYASQHQQTQDPRGGVSNYPEDRASVHSGRSSCDDRLFEKPSIYLKSPNQALYVSYFGSPGCSRSPLWRHSTIISHGRNRTTGDKRTLGDSSLLEDTTIESTRLTPTKFSTSHVQASFSTGSLVQVHASYPADGELARVDILRVSSLLAHDPVVRELVAYPGPLIKQVGVTHKKTIIEYCEAKIKKAESNEEVDDPASYILLYELMVMLIRQNGNVVGVDIAELLLSNQKSYPYIAKRQQIQVRRESTISQKSIVTSGDEITRDTATPLDTNDTSNVNKSLSIDQITDQFRELLLYGCGQEALEYAMNNGLWGHALFLASKLDKRTHASVMTRFANGLTANDPLQTLYQLQSGRVPASVTCVAEPKWGDWRPHLAMIISNTSPNPEINRKAITTLGDTLIGRGHIHAGHFCYILAQVDFGPYGVSTSKLVLLGSNPHKSYNDFVTNEAIMLTEIYEYARNLSEPGFTLIDLQTFKYGLTVKMVDYGLTEKALLYIEQIAVNITREPSKYEISFIEKIHNLGDRIKYSDPVCKDSIEDAANLTWLNNLSEIINKYKTGEITQDGIHDSQNTAPDVNNMNNQQLEQHDSQQQQQQWVVAQPDYADGPTSLMEAPTADVQRDWQPMSLPNTIQDPYSSGGQNTQYGENSLDVSQHQQQQQQQQPQLDYWGQQGYSQQEYSQQDYSQNEWQQNNDQQHQYQNVDQQDNDNLQQEWNYESEKEEKPATPDPPPTISMGPSSTSKQYDPLAELDAIDPPAPTSKSATENKKTNEKSSEKKNSSSGGSWFGGFFSKLAPKPKNQMILPDDSNPTIVWDAVGKKWTNKDADGESSSGALAPPPKASEMGFRLPQTESSMPQSMTMQPLVDQQRQADETVNNNVHKPPSGNNMFKMPRGRNARANYIDVMNPGGQKTVPPSLTPPTAVPTGTTNTANSPQFFIPAPVNDPSAPLDFLTSAAVANGDNTQQGLSRWSSASSLSREVQSYTMRDPRLLQQEKGPMMFNPTDVKDSASKKAPRSRYPPR